MDRDNMPRVIIVTDSSAYLPSELVASLPIRVIPLTLNWDGQTFRDGVDIGATEFYSRLSKSSSLPTTSQISAGEISKTLHELIAFGYDVLFLPISSGVSSTFQTASGAISNFPKGHVTVLDTKLVSMALGFQVLASARAAKAGASLSECTQVAQKAYGQIGVYFTVDTLKFLAAGGRINNAKHLLGTALNIKPVLTICDGKIELVGSVRTHRKAIESMLNLVEEGIAGCAPVRVSVFHAMARETAEQVLETARLRFSPVECILSEISPVVGTHVGPGTIAVAYQVGR